jgi:plastocyanin
MTRNPLNAARSLFIILNLLLAGCSTTAAETPPASATLPPAATPTTPPPSATPTSEPTVAPSPTATLVPPTPTQEKPTPTQAEASPTPTQAAGDRVTISGFSFSPKTLQVKAGTRVTWLNRNSSAHTITADDGSFSSGELEMNDSFSFTFDTAGTFNYHCDFHSGMQGSIEVVP